MLWTREPFLTKNLGQHNLYVSKVPHCFRHIEMFAITSPPESDRVDNRLEEQKRSQILGPRHHLFETCPHLANSERSFAYSHINIGKNILRKMLWMGEPIIWKHGPKENYTKWDFSHLSEFTRTLIFCCTYILRGRKKTQEIVDLWQKERKNYFLEIVFSEAIFA